MIADALRQANSTIKDSVQHRNNKQAAKNFKNQIVELSKYTAQLEPLLNIIVAMQEKNITNKAFTSEIKNALQKAVDNCGEKTNDHTLDVGTVDALKNAIGLCKKTAETAWKEAAEQMAGEVERSLSSLKSLLSDKNEADELLSALRSAKVTIPGSPKVIDSFNENVRRGKNLVDGLHLDKEAEIFVNKVKSQHATVADLTPHIMDWLRDNNLTRQIKVKF